MGTLNSDIQEYQHQLSIGHIQKAYKGIMSFMSGLKAYVDNVYPDFITSALYFGYMDMTYFAFTPPELRAKKLKVAIVYLHEIGRFEIWLGGNNRRIQADYIERLRHAELGKYHLSQVAPGVDSIIETVLVAQPDFDQLEDLKVDIEKKTLEFIQYMKAILEQLD